MSENEILKLYREADAFLNVPGAQESREEHLSCVRRIYVETDPVASQIRVSQGDETMISILTHHDTFFSFGENFGAPDCQVPSGIFEWQPTRQPIVMSIWENHAAENDGPYSTNAVNAAIKNRVSIGGG